MPARISNNQYQWYQLSIVELIIVAATAAVFIRLSTIEHNLGFGLAIVGYGFPLPCFIDHPLNGQAVHGIALAIDLLVWFVATTGIIIAKKNVRECLLKFGR